MGTPARPARLTHHRRCRAGQRRPSRALLTLALGLLLSCGSQEPDNPDAATFLRVEGPRRLSAGMSAQLSARLVNEKGQTLGGPAPTWESSDPSVATVSPDGLLQTLQVGSVSIAVSLEDYDQSIDYIVEADTTAVRVAPNVRVLGPSARSMLIAARPDTLTFDYPEAVHDIAVGDIVVAGVTNLTPDGFFGRVTSRTTDADGFTVLAFEPAALSDAITDVSLAADLPLAPPGPATGSRRGSLVFNLFNQSVGPVTVDATVMVEPTDFTFHPVIKGGTLDTLILRMSAKISSTLSAKLLLASTSLASVHVFGSQRLPPIVVVLGFVPVVITPEVELDLRQTGSAASGFQINSSASSTFDYSATYAQGSFNHAVTVTPSYNLSQVVPISASYKVSLGPAVYLALYSRRVFYSSVSAPIYARLAYTAATDPDLKAFAGFELTAELGSSGFLGPLLKSVKATLYQKEFLVYQRQLMTISPDPLVGTTGVPYDFAFGPPPAPGQAYTEYEWDFGDGTGRSLRVNDNTMTHTFSSPDTFTVTVRLLDQSGNLTRQASSIAQIGGSENYRLVSATGMPYVQDATVTLAGDGSFVTDLLYTDGSHDGSHGTYTTSGTTVTFVAFDGDQNDIFNMDSFTADLGAQLIVSGIESDNGLPATMTFDPF